MSYKCKTLVELVCTEWVEDSFLPQLTASDRDILLQWVIGIFALIFVAKKILRLF